LAYRGRGPDLPARDVVAWTAGTAAIYLILFGAGIGSWWVAALGVLPIAGVIAAYAVLVVRARAPVWVSATIHVVTVSSPPESEEYGRCELKGIVEAPGVPPAMVTVRDPRVPVAKWPEAGATLPVMARADDPRRLRIMWDDVLTHAEATAGLAEDHLGHVDDDADDRVDDDAPSRWHADLDPPPITEEELAALGAGPGLGFAPSPRRVLPLEDEPSSLTSRYLFPTERYRGEWRRHVVRPGRWYVVLLLFAIAGISAVRQEVRPEYVTEAIAAICAVGAVGGGYTILAWYFNRFVLTNKRMLLVGGMLQRRVSSMALLRITDLRFEQSPSGRLFGYGDFVLEGARRFSRMRRVADLPRPNELYLRFVEELYEPEAVEARLGRADYDDDRYPPPRAFPDAGPAEPGYGSPDLDNRADRDYEDRDYAGSAGPDRTPVPPWYPPSETLSQAVREAIYGPTLTNYDGWVTVEVLDRGRRLPVSEDRHVRLEPGRSYEVRVVIAAEPVGQPAEPLVVTGGADHEAIEFAVEIDSDQRALRCPSRLLTVDADGGAARFTIRTPEEGFGVPPWLWIRVSQQRRLLQSIELTAAGPAMLER
jgi:hypothetical protein